MIASPAAATAAGLWRRSHAWVGWANDYSRPGRMAGPTLWGGRANGPDPDPGASPVSWPALVPAESRAGSQAESTKSGRQKDSKSSKSGRRKDSGHEKLRGTGASKRKEGVSEAAVGQS